MRTWLLVGLVLSLATRVAAQDEAPELLFQRAVELYREGDLDAALAQFERVYELAPKPGILYNLAQLQAERHQYVAASALYERYLEAVADDESDPRTAEARSQLDKLRARIGELSVEGNVEGATLFVNDERVGTLPLAQPLKVDAGVNRIRVAKRGYQPVVQTLKVVGGDRPRLVLSLQSSEAKTASPKLDPGRPSYRPFWIASAATLTLGAVSLSTGLLTMRADRNLDRTLDQLPVRNDAVTLERNYLRTYAALTDGFGAASIVALGVSLYLLIRPPTVVPRERQTRIGVAPTARGLSLHGSF